MEWMHACILCTISHHHDDVHDDYDIHSCFACFLYLLVVQLNNTHNDNYYYRSWKILQQNHICAFENDIMFSQKKNGNFNIRLAV